MISIKEHATKLLHDRYGLDAGTVDRMFKDKVLTDHSLKKVLVADEFLKRQKDGKSKTEIKILLSDRFCISYSLVQKYIAHILNGSSDG